MKRIVELIRIYWFCNGSDSSLADIVFFEFLFLGSLKALKRLCYENVSTIL